MSKAKKAKKKKCGIGIDCPRLYSLSDVNASAAAGGGATLTEMASVNSRMSAACAARGRNTFAPLPGGGWCIDTRSAVPVNLARNQTYGLPKHHKPADGLIVATLIALLTRQFDAPASPRWMTLIDFGAGVGQYGHALLSQEPQLNYRGYDGAGGVETFTRGFLRYVDLTVQLSLPRADWVLSLEVGEHLNRSTEQAFVHNLHAHNCKGVLLSWAMLGMQGHGHINNHSPQYVRSLFLDLGYRFSRPITISMRKGLGLEQKLPHIQLNATPFANRNFWFRRESTMAFERIVPLEGAGCT